MHSDEFQNYVVSEPKFVLSQRDWPCSEPPAYEDIWFWRSWATLNQRITEHLDKAADFSRCDETPCR